MTGNWDICIAANLSLKSKKKKNTRLHVTFYLLIKYIEKGNIKTFHFNNLKTKIQSGLGRNKKIIIDYLNYIYLTFAGHYDE